MSTRSPLRSVSLILLRSLPLPSIHRSSTPMSMLLRIYQLMMSCDSRSVLISLTTTRVVRSRLKNSKLLSQLLAFRNKREKYCRSFTPNLLMWRWTSRLSLKYLASVETTKTSLTCSSSLKYLTKREQVTSVLTNLRRFARV